VVPVVPIIINHFLFVEEQTNTTSILLMLSS